MLERPVLEQEGLEQLVDLELHELELRAVLEQVVLGQVVLEQVVFQIVVFDPLSQAVDELRRVLKVLARLETSLKRCRPGGAPVPPGQRHRVTAVRLRCWAAVAFSSSTLHARSPGGKHHTRRTCAISHVGNL